MLNLSEPYNRSPTQYLSLGRYPNVDVKGWAAEDEGKVESSETKV